MRVKPVVSRRRIEQIPNRQSLRLGLSCRPWCPRHQGRRRIGSPPKSGQTSSALFVWPVKDGASLAENAYRAIPRLWYDGPKPERISTDHTDANAGPPDPRSGEDIPMRLGRDRRRALPGEKSPREETSG